jgi:uncharacterized protein with FMN-binding domain
MAKKMPRGLVALSSSAIAAIYLAGFAYTRGADAGLASVATSVPTTVPASPAATATSTTGAAPTAGATSTAAATSTPAATSTAVATSTPTSTAASTTAAYRDGTYTGSGTSRRGNVSVSVTIQSGRIANVTISSVTTQYPVSRIAALPAQVVARQSGQVDNVSGATYSAQAFSLAVQAALSQASA